MILSLIVATIVFLIFVWIGNLIIYGIFFILDIVSKKVKNEILATTILITTIITHLFTGFYFQFYSLTKLSKYFNDNYNMLTIFLIIPLLLGYSLLKKIGQQFDNQINSDEDKYISANNYLRNNMKNATDIATRGMRSTLFSFINLFGTIFSVVLFLFYYFNNSIFNWALNYLP